MMHMNTPDTLSSGLDPNPIDQILYSVVVYINIIFVGPTYLVDVAWCSILSYSRPCPTSIPPVKWLLPWLQDPAGSGAVCV